MHVKYQIILICCCLGRNVENLKFPHFSYTGKGLSMKPLSFDVFSDVHH